MNDKHLLRTFEHMYWADRKTLGGLRNGLPSAAVRALKVFGHVIAAEAVWLARLHGEDWTSIPIWPEWGIDECAARQEANERGYRAFLETTPDERLESTIDYRSSKGDPFQTAIQDVLMHVAMHGVWHRGQVAMLVREAGGAPVNTDFAPFTRETAR